MFSVVVGGALTTFGMVRVFMNKRKIKVIDEKLETASDEGYDWKTYRSSDSNISKDIVGNVLAAPFQLLGWLFTPASEATKLKRDRAGRVDRIYVDFGLIAMGALFLTYGVLNS
ncbi:Transmembrane domain-containing protein [Orpheovirus IHUMI-LCC2]|uniref:Transmembrane domain-containing protein n=1 Tax=Orpheovirus IHUMI-LCC2 TaxID=2023057 RepID=A0A2I2L4E7_9VIRU|nr:Transmembrane domain-containing protein [Orpheovirus IHUMI-LCC2]SNW62339.1 Transmembrane domain-containing protein [Orpheovirus IHUMI-LCC2]